MCSPAPGSSDLGLDLDGHGGDQRCHRVDHALLQPRLRLLGIAFGHFENDQTEGLRVLFTSGGESPTIPVTREAWLRAQIFTLEGKEQEKLKEAIATTMQLYANDSIGREKTLAGLKALGDKRRAQIAAMTAEERASPAWTNDFDLVPAGTPGASTVVRRNPAFYRARRSPFEIRAILVQVGGAREEMKAVNRQVYEEFDWDGLKKLLAP